jgi:hypothetical protein
MGFIADNGFVYVIDNDPNLLYRKILGAGGYGSVHEVLLALSRLTLRSTTRLRTWSDLEASS